MTTIAFLFQASESCLNQEFVETGIKPNKQQYCKYSGETVPKEIRALLLDLPQAKDWELKKANVKGELDLAYDLREFHTLTLDHNQIWQRVQELHDAQMAHIEKLRATIDKKIDRYEQVGHLSLTTLSLTTEEEKLLTDTQKERIGVVQDNRETEALFSLQKLLEELANDELKLLNHYFNVDRDRVTNQTERPCNTELRRKLREELKQLISRQNVLREQAKERTEALAEAKKEADQKAIDEWIEKHGSSRLKKAWVNKYSCHRLYVQERATHEFPDFYLDFDDELIWKDRVSPSEEALDFSAEFDGSRVVWVTSRHDDDDDDDKEIEAVIISDFLGKYTLVKYFAD